MSNNNETRNITIGLILTLFTAFTSLGSILIIIAGASRLENIVLFSLLLIMLLNSAGFLYGIMLLNKSGFFDGKMFNY